MVALIPEENIEEELRSWKGLLDVIDKAVDSSHECLSKESKVEDQSSQESTLMKVANRQTLNCPGLSCLRLMVMC